jgi:hypothetical protein
MAASKIGHLLLDPAKALTQHASMRSFERDFTFNALKEVADNGQSYPHPEGDHKLMTEARDPDNLDTIWKVSTDNNPVTKLLTVMKDTSRPFADVQAKAKADKLEAGTDKLRVDTTASRKAAQKAKKQERSAKASNKQPRGKK